MRIVVDTNVLISAVFKDDTPPFHVVEWIERHGDLLQSIDTELEILEVLGRPHIAAMTIPLFAAGLRRILGRSQPIAIAERIAACRDPKDDKFLELAVNGRADVVVTGDADLLSLSPFRGIPIETSAAFLRRITE